VEGYHQLFLPGRRVAGHAVVPVHDHDLGPCGFAAEDSSSYSGGRNTFCKADPESTERDRSRTAYMPV
jgi:hypothetical protein